jgi:hypothetical protein
LNGNVTQYITTGLNEGQGGCGSSDILCLARQQYLPFQIIMKAAFAIYNAFGLAYH